ncbi:MAG: beta-propeller fold lactonase family protein [Pseudonocardiaceae bacterium]
MTNQLVFIQTNNAAGNQIQVYNRAGNGTLTLTETVDTGGDGGVSAAGPGPDPLNSQGALVYDPHHRVLIAVNASSNTVSVLGLEDDHLRLRQVLPSGGTFPVSVTVHGDLLYVLNVNGTGTITGYRVTEGQFHPIEDSTRSLKLPPASLPHQIGFTPDGHHLVVTTPANNGQIDVFTVRPDGRPSDTFVANPVSDPPSATNPTGAADRFGFIFDDHDHLVVTDANASTLTTYTINPAGDITQIASQADGQVAMCWVARAAGNFYVADIGSNTVTGYHINPAGTPTVFTRTPTRANPMDLAGTSDGQFLYVEVGGVGGVDGFHIKPDGTLAQIVTLTGINGLEGIALT